MRSLCAVHPHPRDVAAHHELWSRLASAVNRSKAQVTLGGLKGFKVVGLRNERVMKQYVGRSGPLSVCVNATRWHHYREGVMTGCDDRRTDHCVQLVGYGHDAASGLDYWKLRNSWGTQFGEGGYLRVEMGTDACDISSFPTRVIAGEVRQPSHLT